MTNAGKNPKPQRTQRYTKETQRQITSVKTSRFGFPLYTFVSFVVNAFDSK
jgi:hypothetical protein